VGLVQAHQPLGRDRRANPVEGHAGGEVRGDWREHVASMEARADNRQQQPTVLDRADLDDPAEQLGRLDQQAVVRPDQAVAADGSHRQARRAVPTPGWTTPTWVPTGTLGRVTANVWAPSATE
jgi:hypothetical protein